MIKLGLSSSQLDYRPVRQRTVRSETTKDKAGALPPAVYSNSNTDVTTRVSFQADQVEETPAVSSDMPSAVTDVPVLNFVSDATVPQLGLSSSQLEEHMTSFPRLTEGLNGVNR